METHTLNSAANYSKEIASPSLFRSLYRRLFHRNIPNVSYCKTRNEREK